MSALKGEMTRGAAQALKVEVMPYEPKEKKRMDEWTVCLWTDKRHVNKVNMKNSAKLYNRKKKLRDIQYVYKCM